MAQVNQSVKRRQQKTLSRLKRQKEDETDTKFVI